MAKKRDTQIRAEAERLADALNAWLQGACRNDPCLAVLAIAKVLPTLFHLIVTNETHDAVQIREIQQQTVREFHEAVLRMTEELVLIDPVLRERETDGVH